MKKEYPRCFHSFAILAAVGALVSCGGGSGNSDPVSESTARQCFDESFLKNTAATWDFTYEHFLDGASSPVISSKKFRIESVDGVFGEEKNLIVLGEHENSLGASSAAITDQKTFLRLQDNGNRTIVGLTRNGKISILFSNRTEFYSPAYSDTTASLKKGETASIKMTGRFESTLPEASAGSIDSSFTIKYVGNEIIDTAAGKFNACHFERNGEQEWIWRGFPIQFTEGRGLRRVTSVKLNDQIVQP